MILINRISYCNHNWTLSSITTFDWWNSWIRKCSVGWHHETILILRTIFSSLYAGISPDHWNSLWGSVYIIFKRSYSCLPVHPVLFSPLFLPSVFLSPFPFTWPLDFVTCWGVLGICYDLVFELIIVLACFMLPFEVLGVARQVFGVFGALRCI
jgi:hypothetical protein